MFQALGIDLVSLLWQIVAFIALIWLLNRLLYRPMRRTLDERAQRIQESMEEAERVKQQAIKADEEFAARMQEAQQQARQIEDQARETARQEREDMLERAREESQQFLQDARLQLDLERRDAARETRRQVAALAVLAAGRLIDETLDAERHQRLVDQYLADLDQPLAELERALVDLSVEKLAAAQVRSAAPLSEETQQLLRTRLVEAFGEGITVSFSSDARLIGGFVLQVGDQVVDLSVARKLGDLFRELAA